MRIRGPVFPRSEAPSWPGAVWIGELSTDEGSSSDGEDLDGTEGYSNARLLVRDAAGVRGLIDVPLEGGRVPDARLQEEVRRLGDPVPDPLADDRYPSFSVVVCTRERPDDLRTAVDSLLALDYQGEFEVVIVDNAPVTTATADYVRSVGDSRIRLVAEPAPGLSRARNAGVAAARHEWLAFTDDDVSVDRRWLTGLARGIGRAGGSPDCVTGLVPTGELRTAAQSWFDRRISWGKVVLPRTFSLADPPADLPMFPFQVSAYGTGANFATRREVVRRLGGFDPHLGAGTRSKGGEDIDFFFRVITRGGVLAYEPSAFVWHRHRETQEALESQAVGYGRGLTAWVTKAFFEPVGLARGLRSLLRKETLNLTPFRNYRNPTQVDDQEQRAGIADVSAIEHRALRSGPWSYVGPRFFGR